MNILIIKPPSIITYCIANLSEDLIVLSCLSNLMKFDEVLGTEIETT